MVQIFKRAERLVVTLGLIAVLLVGYLPASIVHAVVNSCSAEVTPQTISPGQAASFQFRINNPTGQGNDPIKWIQITRPSANYSIENALSSGWSGSTTSDTALLTGGTLNAGTVLTANVTSAVANVEAPDNSWQVEVSSDPGGAGPANCGGSLHSTISDGTPPVISNINASAITPDSATINWTTDEPATSLVNYDLTPDYNNSSDYDSNLVTSHSVKLSGLFAGIGYHFDISSNDGAGNGTTSDDNTFVTAEKPAVIVTKTVNVPGIAVQVTNPADKTPPTITLSTNLPKVVKTIPVITGTASDDLAVVRIEYSTDGGQNWLPVDNAPALGGKTVPFSFTPANLDDGNYTVLARAIDAGGNITATAPITVVIDRLQPIVGGSVLNLGPQILRSNDNGMINTTVGVDQKITLSAVGGPTTINLTAANVNSKLKTKTFSLTQSNDTGLWRGILSFGDAGTYNLIAKATDGAGNKTNRVLATVEVSSAGKVIKKGTNQAVKNAKVTVYYLDNESNSWVAWDGAAYGQTNPQTTGKDGQFNLFLPTGKYYLKTTAPGYRSLTSSAFTITEPTPISTTLAMTAGHSLWPSFSTQKISLNNPNTSESKQTNTLIGRQVPTFSLTNMNGKKVNSLDWLGKPTLISLNATWSPETIDQLKVLQQMQSNQNYNVISVGLEQTASQLGVYNNLSGLNLNWLPDPDGSLASVFYAQGLPTNYFVDRTGVIRHVTSGVLTQQQILDGLTGL